MTHTTWHFLTSALTPPPEPGTHAGQPGLRALVEGRRAAPGSQALCVLRTAPPLSSSTSRFSPQITQLKIASNPFAKGFRDCDPEDW